jgi:DNA-binding transcriptional ArsR family regulator
MFQKRIGATVERGEETDGEPAAEPPVLSENELFDVLRNPRRRATMKYLRAEGSADVSDLVDHVGAREFGVEPEALARGQRKSVHVSLYQTHLPKLDDAGVVEYDPDRGTVEVTDAASRLYPLLDDSTARAAPSRVHAAVLATLGAVVLAGAVGLPGLASLSPAGWAGVGGVALVAAGLGAGWLAVGHKN